MYDAAVCHQLIDAWSTYRRRVGGNVLVQCVFFAKQETVVQVFSSSQTCFGGISSVSGDIAGCSENLSFATMTKKIPCEKMLAATDESNSERCCIFQFFFHFHALLSSMCMHMHACVYRHISVLITLV